MAFSGTYVRYRPNCWTHEKLTSRNLRDQGVKLPKTLPRKLSQHILSGTAEPFSHAGRTQPKEISLTFDDADHDEVTRVVDKFLNI